MSESATNDIRERMQECARAIEAILPPFTGFIVFAFDLQHRPNSPPGRFEYVSNGQRADCVRALKEFIAKSASPWLTVPEAATYARSSVRQIKDAIAAGFLAAVVHLRPVRLHRDDINAWLDRNKLKPFSAAEENLPITGRPRFASVSHSDRDKVQAAEFSASASMDGARAEAHAPRAPASSDPRAISGPTTPADQTRRLLVPVWKHCARVETPPSLMEEEPTSKERTP